MDSKIQEYLKKKLRFSESGELYQSVEGVAGATRDMETRWKLYDISPENIQSKSILDVGCNIGGFSRFCSKSCSGYHGIDIDPESIDLARHLYPFPNCSFEVGSFVTMSIKVKYDVLFSFAVWYYTQVPFEHYLAKVASLLFQGGTLFFESHANDQFPKLQEEFERHFETIRVIPSPTVNNGVRSDNRFFGEFRRKTK